MTVSLLPLNCSLLKSTQVVLPRKYLRTSRQERAFVAALRERLPDLKILTGYHYLGVPAIPDAYLPELKLCIFVDGCYWHGCPEHGPKRKTKRVNPREKRLSDIAQTKALKARGLNVLRWWEHELKGNIPRCVEYIAASIEGIE